MCFGLNTSVGHILPQNERAAAMWSAGARGYDRISCQTADAIEHCVERLAPQPGQRILDVATGTGWAARRVAKRGASVTAVDFSEALINAARELDRSGLIDFRVGDAECLAITDNEFDGVISTFGVMFCRDPVRASRELIRVCKPGGKLALVHWDDHGAAAELCRLIHRHELVAATAGTFSVDWTRDDQLCVRFGSSGDVQVERAVSFYREADETAAWDALVSGYGPVAKLNEQLPAHALAELQRDIIRHYARHSTPAGILVPRPYVVAIATRADG